MAQLDYFERNLNTLASILAKMLKLKYADLDVSEMKELNTFCVNELDLDLKKLLNISLENLATELTHREIRQLKIIEKTLSFFYTNSFDENGITQSESEKNTICDKIILTKFSILSNSEALDLNLLREIRQLLQERAGELPEILKSKIDKYAHWSVKF